MENDTSRLINKIKKLLFNFGIIGIGVGAYCYDIIAFGYVYVFISWCVGIISFLHLLGGPNDDFAKSTAKERANGSYLGEFVEGILWVVMILFPVSHGYILYGFCWFLLFVVYANNKDKINEYYKKYVSDNQSETQDV